MELIPSNDHHFSVSFKKSGDHEEKDKEYSATSLLRQQLEELDLRTGCCGSSGTLGANTTPGIEAFPLEILENIVIHLDLLSLARLRRTCTYMYDTITNKLPLVWLKQYEYLASSISLLDKPAIIDGFENSPNNSALSSPSGIGVIDMLETLPSSVNLNVGSTGFLISRASSGIDAATAMFLDRKGGRSSFPRDLGCTSWQSLCKDLLSTVLQPVDIVTPNCSTWRVYAFQPGSPLIPLTSTSSSIVISEDELSPNIPISLLFVIDTSIENPTHLLNGFYITSTPVPEENEEQPKEEGHSSIPPGWPSCFSDIEISSNSRFFSRGGGRQRSVSRGPMNSYVTGIFAERLLCGGAQTSSIQSLERFKVKNERWCPTNNFCVRFWYTSSGESSFDPPPVILNPIQNPNPPSFSSFLSSSPTAISPICTPSPISVATSSKSNSSTSTSPTSSGVIGQTQTGPSRMICRREIRALYDGEKKKHIGFTSGMRVAFAVRASLDLGGGEVIFGIKFK